VLLLIVKSGTNVFVYPILLLKSKSTFSILT